MPRTSVRSSTQWRTAFVHQHDGLDDKRQTVIEVYKVIRERVALLLQFIQRDLPDLMLPDITCVEALWRVAYDRSVPTRPGEKARLAHGPRHPESASRSPFPACPAKLNKIRSALSEFHSRLSEFHRALSDFRPGLNEFRPRLNEIRSALDDFRPALNERAFTPE